MPNDTQQTELQFTTPQPLDADAPANALLNLDDDGFTKALGFTKTPAAVEAAPPETAPPAPDSEPTEVPPSDEAPQPPAAETEAEPPAEPAAEEPAAAEPPAEPPKPPLTKFDLYDAEGPLQVPEDIKFRFKAAGKTYEDVPLEKVVLLAQMGVANQEREAQVLGAKKFVAESQQRLSELEQTVQKYETYYQRLFTEPELYEAARDEFALSNSPERRAARAEAQLQAERQRSAMEAQSTQVASFVQGVLMPKAEQLLKQYPTVSQEELLGRFAMTTAPLQVRGIVPPERLGEVQALFDHDIAEWAKQQHTLRELDRREVDTQKQLAKTKAQQAKKQLARAVAPPPAGAPPSTSSPKKSYDTVEDWMNSTFPAPGE